ncbi:MAG: methyltransferase [Ottowia sp.]|uniref:methyltransferase family protein n=1 Tax=Ottowia sp. TaxID=1898956 RepID=UPI003C74CAB7
MVAFRRAKTTVNPVKANMASSLVIGGVYRYTRNPMYVGLLLTLSTWASRLRCSSSTRASSVASLQIALSGTRLADCSCLQRQRGQRRRLG